MVFSRSITNLQGCLNWQLTHFCQFYFLPPEKVRKKVFLTFSGVEIGHWAKMG